MHWRARMIAAAFLVVTLMPGGRAHGAARGMGSASLLPVIQDQDGSIAGRVVGPGGVGLPGVTVTVEGPSPILFRATTTGSLGSYRFTALSVGLYTVTFTLDRFAWERRTNIAVAAGASTHVDASLVPASRGESPGIVFADSGAPLADTQPPRNRFARPNRPVFGDGSGPGWLTPGDAAGVDVRSAVARFTGSADFSITDQRLQSDNVSPELKAQGASFGSPVHRVTHTEFEAGGPLSPNRAWLSGSAGRTTEDVGLIGFFVPGCLGADGSPVADAAYRADCLQGDTTTTSTVNLELQYRWTPAHRSVVAWGRSDRRKPNRGASAYTRPEATTKQSSLSWAQPFQVQHQWVVSGRSVIDATMTYRDASVVFDFQDPRLADVQGAYDRYTLVQSRSAVQRTDRRSALTVAVTGAHRVENLLGGSHAVTFGAEVVDSTRRQQDRTGGGAVAVFDSRGGSPLAYQARIVRDGMMDLAARTVSAFVQDTYARGRMTIDVGLRWGRQDDEARATTIPASPILPDLLPAVRFAGADSGVVFDDLSPRFGVVWDVTGNGRTLVGATVVRSVGAGNTTSAALQPTGQTRLVYWWADADGDRIVDRSELDLPRGLAATPSANYDAANPAAVRSPATVDPGLKNTASDELSFRVERELARRLALRVTYVGRTRYQVRRTFPVEADGSPVASETFVPVTWTPTTCPAGAECPAVTYYERAEPLPSATVLRNDGEYGWRHGVVAILHKRMSDGWMLNLSARWETAAWHFPRPTADYTDPTNIAVANGAEDEALGSHWSVDLTGTARLRWGLTVSGLVTAQQGHPYVRGVTTPNRGALGSTVVDLKPYGSERYPAVRRVDWRGERLFRAGRLEIVPAVNVFNLLNSSVVLARNRVQNTPTANAVTKIQAPRAVRLDLGVTW
jgi:Carboxypeptidase regulatory-like domain